MSINPYEIRFDTTVGLFERIKLEQSILSFTGHFIRPIDNSPSNNKRRRHFGSKDTSIWEYDFHTRYKKYGDGTDYKT